MYVCMYRMYVRWYSVNVIKRKIRIEKLELELKNKFKVKDVGKKSGK